MRYVTYYNTFLSGPYDVEIHDGKDEAVKFYRREAHRYFDGLRLPEKTTPPAACGFPHRYFGVMSVRMFRKRFPEWNGDTKCKR